MANRMPDAETGDLTLNPVFCWNACSRFHAAIAGWVAWFFPFFRLVPAVRPEDMNEDPKVCVMIKAVC